jgi:hypothetical protein
MRLTDHSVKTAKPTDKPYKLFDSGGLYIQIEPSGGKLWRFKYRFEGKAKKCSLWQYPDISLLEARNEVRGAFIF